jgi:hypothetical protein
LRRADELGLPLGIGAEDVILAATIVWHVAPNYRHQSIEEKRLMNGFRCLLLMALLLSPNAASAGTANGSGALALAALVGNISPLVSNPQKDALTKLLDGQANFSFPAGKTITVAAEKVTCRASNVDIASHACDLSFGGQVVSLKGRSAHELFATLAEVGVQPDGAAGSIFEAISNLECTIDPNEVKQNSGGGAECHYAPPN